MQPATSAPSSRDKQPRAASNPSSKIQDPKSRRHVLVTGAAGFIGSNLVHWLLRQRENLRVTSVDALFYAGNLANLEDLTRDDRHRFIHGNICDRQLIAGLLDDGVDAIINAAAQTHVDRSLMGADEFVSSNLGGVQVQLDLLKQRPHIRFLQVSTDEVYGSRRPDDPAAETAALCPRNPYAATKAGADLLALSYHHSFGLDVVITRCCNNYGPYHYPEKVIPLFITNLLDGQKVPLYGDGLNYREWIHVDDHCAAIARVLAAGRSGEVYNITSGEGMPNVELTRRILAALDRDESFIRHVTDRPGHDRCYLLDGSKIERELGWSAAVHFDEGLKQTVQWYRENEAWWRPIKSGEYRRYYERQYGQRGAK
ncbi:MAG: dTDP-glucose 4,6-dehydratase [Phycisphaerae bacterium]|jgi:dTDP-glucose 4,6-dehydratase